MNSVITAEQAKKITGGRTPLVPVEYEAAVKSLQACATLDEAKYWSDKSDALAAWAKAGGYSMTGFRGFCRKNSAVKLAALLQPGEVSKTRELVTEIAEWLDAFEQALPKEHT